MWKHENSSKNYNFYSCILWLAFFYVLFFIFGREKYFVFSKVFEILFCILYFEAKNTRSILLEYFVFWGHKYFVFCNCILARWEKYFVFSILYFELEVFCPGLKIRYMYLHMSRFFWKFPRKASDNCIA